MQWSLVLVVRLVCLFAMSYADKKVKFSVYIFVILGPSVIMSGSILVKFLREVDKILTFITPIRQKVRQNLHIEKALSLGTEK